MRSKIKVISEINAIEEMFLRIVYNTEKMYKKQWIPRLVGSIIKPKFSSLIWICLALVWYLFNAASWLFLLVVFRVLELYRTSNLVNMCNKVTHGKWSSVNYSVFPGMFSWFYRCEWLQMFINIRSKYITADMSNIYNRKVKTRDNLT